MKQVWARIRVGTKPRTRTEAATSGWKRCRPGQGAEPDLGGRRWRPRGRQSHHVLAEPGRHVRGRVEHRGRGMGAPLSTEATGSPWSSKGPCTELYLKGGPNVSWQSWGRELKVGRNCGRWKRWWEQGPKSKKARDRVCSEEVG